MKSTHLPAVFTLLGMAGFVTAAPGNGASPLAQRDGVLSQNCKNMALRSWTLSADCHVGGSYNPTTLNLTKCLGWGAGGYVLCEPQL